MDKEAMKQQILEALSKKLGDRFHLSIKKVLKRNVRLDGLTIRQDGKDIAPTIYLEPLYEALNNGASIDDITDRILQAYSNSKIYSDHFDSASLLSNGLPYKKIYVELVNRHLNEELLRNVPHSLFLDDFAIVVRCMVDSTEKETTSFLVNNYHINFWNVSQETLISHALQNTRTLMGINLQSMENVLRSMNQDLREMGILDPSLWVLTNERGISGAATVLFDDILKDFATEHGSFYVIFSSVHEVLLLPESCQFTIGSLTKINQEVNTVQVREDEILGIKAYYYSKDNGFVF